MPFYLGIDVLSLLLFCLIKNSENVSIFISLLRIRGPALKDATICDIMYCISLIWKEREREKKVKEREKDKQTSKETRRNSVEIFSGKEVLD